MRAPDARLQGFLEIISDPARPTLTADNVAVVVAHPDDETIGCGALLSRLAGAYVIVITDGAPRDLADAHMHGFETAEAYALARRAELHAALRTAGIAAERVRQLDIPDQQTTRNFRFITDRLARLLSRYKIRIVLTHSYEGGHPDHDAAAFCVRQTADRTDRSIAILEMPYYRASGDGAVQQSFAPDGRRPIIVLLNYQEGRLKRQMISAYSTQANVLTGFSLETEQFRVAPDYDFRQLPNGGHLLYERENWGLTRKDWLRLVDEYFTSQQVCA